MTLRRFDRRRIGWRFQLPSVRAVEGKAAIRVLLGRDTQVGLDTLLVLRMKMAQEGHAPAAAGPGPEALADQGGNGRFLTLQVVANFPQGDMETQADLVVRVHEG